MEGTLRGKNPSRQRRISLAVEEADTGGNKGERGNDYQGKV